MSHLRLGELCAGYGGLGMAVEEVFNATTAWFSEFDDAPSKILAHHWPEVPNYGDMTKIDWAAIEQADIISGGTPCQDLSAAGRRAGMTEGTRSNLWGQMREAIAIQRPRYVVWENVRGAYSAEAASDLEQCPGCMGDAGDGGTFLRALGRVLGDLSDLGYDCQWRGLRAADVGACHGRFRVFVLARDSQMRGRNDARHSGTGSDQEWERPRQVGGSSSSTPNSDGQGLEVGWNPGLVPGASGNDSAATFRDQEPAADPESIGRRERRTESARFQRRLDAPIGSGPLATNTIGSGCDGGTRKAGREAEQRALAERPGEGTSWGKYELGIRRQELSFGRPVTRPTEPTGRKGGERLSPRFTEWMMGLPDGWVTDPAIGISRNEQLKACGNGVVPQQAMAALRDMLAAFQSVEVAA